MVELNIRGLHKIRQRSRCNQKDLRQSPTQSETELEMLTHQLLLAQKAEFVDQVAFP